MCLEELIKHYTSSRDMWSKLVHSTKYLNLSTNLADSITFILSSQPIVIILYDYLDNLVSHANNYIIFDDKVNKAYYSMCLAAWNIAKLVGISKASKLIDFDYSLNEVSSSSDIISLINRYSNSLNNSIALTDKATILETMGAIATAKKKY
jgi:hypothetical protein